MSDKINDMDFDSDDSTMDPDFVHPSPELEAESEEDINQLPCHQLPQANSKFSRKKNKENRNSGKPYITKSGKEIAERKCVPLGECRKKCAQKISIEQQKSIFQQYWQLVSYDKRILHMSSLIEVQEKLTQTLRKHCVRPKNRQNTIYYYIQLNGRLENVCQACFLKCFGETASLIRSVIKKKIESPNIPLCDRRGYSIPKTKLSPERIQLIKQHIDSFPAYESHYCRRHTEIKYLSSELSISQMHKLYCTDREPVSITKYAEVFHSMKLKFKHPKLDTCNRCDTFKCKLTIADKASNEFLELQSQQKSHHEDAEAAYKCKENDKKLSKLNKNIKTYTFDLQQCLPTPYLKTSICYYKRQLNTFNLTVHDCETNQPYCFMWHEGLAQRGANEIASCLFKHLNSIASDQSVDSLIFYSDSCAGQNKNSFVSSMFIYFLQNNPHIKTIDHKFLVPGHTHMECDVDHAAIERKKKKTSAQIHHPRDWYQFVRSIGERKTFIVMEMNSTDMLNFNSLSKTKLLWRKVNEKGNKFYWRDVRWLRYTNSNFGTVLYKSTLKEEDEFESLKVHKRGINTLTLSDIEHVKKKPAISKEKKADLQSILHLIDPCFHDFYNNLKDENIPNTDPDIIDENFDINDSDM